MQNYWEFELGIREFAESFQIDYQEVDRWKKLVHISSSNDFFQGHFLDDLDVHTSSFKNTKIIIL